MSTTESTGAVRSSALWGKRTGLGPGVRGVGWKGGRVALAAMTATLSLVVAGPALAGKSNSDAYVPSSLLTDAQAHPDNVFSVDASSSRSGCAPIGDM